MISKFNKYLLCAYYIQGRGCKLRAHRGVRPEGADSKDSGLAVFCFPTLKDKVLLRKENIGLSVTIYAMKPPCTVSEMATEQNWRVPSRPSSSFPSPSHEVGSLASCFGDTGAPSAIPSKFSRNSERLREISL